jgi:hypothetical protein
VWCDRVRTGTEGWGGGNVCRRGRVQTGKEGGEGTCVVGQGADGERGVGGRERVWWGRVRVEVGVRRSKGEPGRKREGKEKEGAADAREWGPLCGARGERR